MPSPPTGPKRYSPISTGTACDHPPRRYAFRLAPEPGSLRMASGPESAREPGQWREILWPVGHSALSQVGRGPSIALGAHRDVPDAGIKPAGIRDAVGGGVVLRPSDSAYARRRVTPPQRRSSVAGTRPQPTTPPVPESARPPPDPTRGSARRRRTTAARPSAGPAARRVGDEYLPARVSHPGVRVQADRGGRGEVQALGPAPDRNA